MPVAKTDRPVVASACNTGRAALLLTAVNPVRKLIVGYHVIKLRSWLVVPGTPGFSAIHSDRSSLIGRCQNDLRVIGIYPERVVIIAAWCALYRDKGFSAVVRTIR